jgi:hypothetical protein
MSRDSPKGLRRMDYYNRIQDFINYALSNPRNISAGRIRYPFKRCKNKKIFQSRCCNDVSSTKKKGSLKNTYVGLYIKNYIFPTRPW